jgi:hypothetical protein
MDGFTLKSSHYQLVRIMCAPVGSLENVNIHTLAVRHAASQFRLGAQQRNVQ